MSTDVWVRDRPRLTQSNYRTLYASPCELHPDGFKWYKGTGISPEIHPLSGTIPFEDCGACHSADVLVVAAQWNVHPFSGDVYWDYELVCQACGKFTQRSYAENS